VNSDFHDLDDFASLWAEEPTPDEKAELVGLAQRVSWRATFLEYWDIGLGVAIAAAALLAVLLQPAPVTLAIGLVAAGGLLWSTWKRHLLKRQVTLLLEVSDRTHLLDLEVRRISTDLQRALVGLVATPPAIALFGMLTHSLSQGGSLAGFGGAVIRNFSSGPVGPMVVAAVLTLIFQQIQIIRRLRRELHRLQIVSGEYREEAQLDFVAIS
jgi:hypothetical protein